jgi:Uma2 family endonuclease
VCEIPIKSAGQTTWKRPDIARGLESNESYYFRAEKLVAVAKSKARRSRKIADYPNPDLAVEVDITPPKIDRPGIYAALKVADVWRFDGDLEQVIIERLQDDGTYRPIEASQFLPIRAARRLRAWARAELTPRLPG